MQKSIHVAGKIFVEGEKIKHSNGNVITIERILDAHKDFGVRVDIVAETSGRRSNISADDLKDFTHVGFSF